MGCISLYWFFIVGNIFCSHLNFKKEGRYDCVVGSNNTDPSHMTEIVLLCNPNPGQVIASSCSSAVYSVSCISTHVMSHLHDFFILHDFLHGLL